jgi:hypothetical protein
MGTLSNEERKLIIDDLIKYYRFCKRDRRNHIFNAIYALKRGRKNVVSKEKKDEAEKLFNEAKSSYGYYCRMLTVALLLKLKRIDFVTPKEKEQALDDLISHYDWRLKTCSFHLQCLERRLRECCRSKGTGNTQEIEDLFAADLRENDEYVKKMELARCFKDEIVI